MIHWHHLAWMAAIILIGFALLAYFGAGMASRALTSDDLRTPRRALALAGLIIAAILLTGCGGRLPPPEPIIRTVEIKVPVDDPACAREAVARLGGAPAYPDTGEAIRSAADLFERVKLLLAARELRIAREAALADALKACADQPGA